MSEQYVNLAQSTNVALIDGVTNPVTFSVAAGDGALFPSTANGNFRVTVSGTDGSGAEVMLCTSRSGDSLTCSRGTSATLESPTPTLIAHSIGSVVSHDITVGAMNQIRSDISQSGSGTLPSVSKAGDLWFPSDSVSIAWSNGTAWSRWGPIFNLTTPPAVGSFTLQNGASASTVSGQDYVGIKITGPSGDLVGMSKAKLASTFTLTVGLMGATIGVTDDLFGIYLINNTGATTSTSTAIAFFRQAPNGLRISLFSGASLTFVGDYINYTDYLSTCPTLFLRIKEDASNRTYYVSPDLQNWLQVFQHAVNTGETTAAYGICGRTDNAASIILVDAIHWVETNP